MNYLHDELVHGVPRPGTVRRSTGADGLFPAEMAIHGRKPRMTQSR
jgi:hypothetical protein